MRAWMVRLGKFGEAEGTALESGRLHTGWQLADISKAASRDEILEKLRTAYPNEKPGTLQNWAVQLNQFLLGMADDDLVIVPLKTTGQVAIGQVQGGYVHSSDGRPSREVKWLRTDLSRSAIKQDLLYSLGATQTVCEISRNNAVARFEVLGKTGRDPGPNLAKAGSAPALTVTPGGEPTEAEDVPTDLSLIARDQIERHIAATFSGHAFTQLIGAILEAQGYRTRISPPGGDRGVDIVAGQGALGFDGPRLVVQVKSGDVVADQPTLQGLLGCIQDTRADHGLLVAWSGFTPPVRQRVNELYFRVRLWGREEILNALFSVYEVLPEELRADLPLRRTWTLVPDIGTE